MRVIGQINWLTSANELQQYFRNTHLAMTACQ